MRKKSQQITRVIEVMKIIMKATVENFSKRTVYNYNSNTNSMAKCIQSVGLYHKFHPAA